MLRLTILAFRSQLGGSCSGQVTVLSTEHPRLEDIRFCCVFTLVFGLLRLLMKSHISVWTKRSGNRNDDVCERNFQKML